VLAEWYGNLRGGAAVERIIGRLDYPRLEKMISFYYAKDLYEAIGKLGFDKVSECIAKLYYGQGLACHQIAELLPVHAHTVKRWMAVWGMERRNETRRGVSWQYSRFCSDCGCDTVPGFRAKGRCWTCYMAYKRKEAHLSPSGDSE